MSSRRLVVVDASIAATGALKGARNIARLATGFAGASLILPRGSSVRPEDAPEFDDVRYWPMPQIRRSARDLALFTPSLALAGVRLARMLRPGDVLVLNDFYLLHGAAARLCGWRGKVVSWVRIDPLRFPAPLRRAWLGAIRRSGARMVAVSRFIAGRLPESAPVLYDPVEPRLEAAGPAAFVAREPRDVVFIAIYIEGEGQDHGLLAFARVAARHPQARLLFHGGDMGLERNRAFRARLEAQADGMGLADRVVFGGFTPDIVAAYRTAAAALVLSAAESFSLVCLETAALGVPVIAFRSGGPEEIVQDDRTGVLCAVGDIEAAATALDRMLADPSAARVMGGRAMADVAERFGEAAYAAKLAEMLG